MFVVTERKKYSGMKYGDMERNANKKAPDGWEEKKFVDNGEE